MLHVYLLKAVVQQAELLVPPHHRGRQRVLCEPTLRLQVHEQKLSTVAVFIFVTREPALRVKVAFLVCVLPLIIISAFVMFTAVTGYTQTQFVAINMAN